MTADARTAEVRSAAPPAETLRFRPTPFDTALGTVAMGVALTAVLVWLLRHLH